MTCCELSAVHHLSGLVQGTRLVGTIGKELHQSQLPLQSVGRPDRVFSERHYETRVS